MCGDGSTGCTLVEPGTEVEWKRGRDRDDSFPEVGRDGRRAGRDQSHKCMKGFGTETRDRDLDGLGTKVVNLGRTDQTNVRQGNLH